MNCLFPDICSDALRESKDFYSQLLGFTPVFEIDWYLQLQSPADPNVQITFVKRDHPSVPRDYQQAPQGVVITVETESVDPVHAKARELGMDIVVELCNEVWGQRDFMTRDPNGLLVDIVQAIEPTQAFIKEHGLAG